jgi:hypothetical protein
MISDNRLQTAFWTGLGRLVLWLLYLLGRILTPFLLVGLRELRGLYLANRFYRGNSA